MQIIENYPDYGIEIDPIRIFNFKTNRWLILNIGSNGYLRVQLTNDCGRKGMLVHRLIAIAFIPNPNNYELINHKDGNKLNNELSNLEWCDYKFNNNHALENKLRVMPKDKECYWTKISKDQYGEIKQLRKSHTVDELIEMYSVCRTTMNLILRS